MDSLPTPGTAFLSSLLEMEEDTGKIGPQYHPTQEQSPPSSEAKSTPQTTISDIQDAPVQDYSQFQKEIERRFRQARESARAPNKPRVIIPEQQVVPAIARTPQTMSPETTSKTFQPIYTPIDFDPELSFSSTPVDLGMSDTAMPEFDTIFSRSVEAPSFQFESPFSHEAAQEVHEPIPENHIKHFLSVTTIPDDLAMETAPNFEYESPFSMEAAQEYHDPIPEMNAKRPPPVTTVSDDLVVQTASKKAKTSLNKDGKPRSRRVLSVSQVKQKRESFLERNRVAAMKCRSKRKDYVQQLHDDMRIRSEENEELRMMHKGLTDEIESLKNMLGRCNDTQKKDVGDNEKTTEATGRNEEMSDKEKTDFMDVLIKEGPRRLS